MGLKLREIGFQRTYIFKIFRGSMPPDPPRKVRLRRTITFSITYEHPLENLSYAPGKGNISGGARERRRHEALGGCGGMLPQKILKSRGLEMLNFQRFPRAICDLRISQIIYFVHCLSKPMHLESKTLVTLITK